MPNVNNPTTDKELVARVEKLERAVFGSHSSVELQTKPRSSPRKGPTGGVVMLIEKKFFDPPHRRGLKEVVDALVEIGKIYSPQAVDMALRRLSNPHGPLVRLKEGSRGRYSARK